MSARLNIVVNNSQTDLVISQVSVQRLVARLLERLGVETTQVNVYFVTKEAIAKLHAEHFQDPTPTDCLSFPLDPPGTPGDAILGEIFVCPQAAIEYASAHNLSPYEEVSLYVIHACLHLIGFADTPEEASEVMKAKENECLQALQSKKCLISY